MVVAAIAGLVAAGISAYSSYQQGQQQQAIAEYNAKVTENEALQADMEARENLRRLRANNRAQLAERRAAIATSGVVGYTGSPLAMLGIEAGRLELAALDESRRARIGLRRGFREAEMTRLEGAQAAQAGKVQAVGTILSTASRAYGNFGG